MNSDIRLATSFRGHRKRKRLRRLLGDRSDSYLIDLWLSVAIDCPEGVLTGWDDIAVADAAGWEGDPEKLISALLECVFLEKTEEGIYALHDWREHQGWASDATRRSEKAAKNQLKRWLAKEFTKKTFPEFLEWYNGKYEYKRGDTVTSILSLYDSYTKGNTGVYESYTDRNTPSPYPKPLPKPLPPLNIDTANAVSSELSASESSKEEEGDQQIFLTVPLIKRDGEFQITEDDVIQWQETFPALDVRQKLREIRQWNIDNPKNRKTKSGARKHISSWLSRDQNKARTNGQQQTRQETPAAGNPKKKNILDYQLARDKIVGG